MVDHRILEPRHHGLPVGCHIQRRQRRRDLVPHHGVEEMLQFRIGDGLAHERVAARQAKIGQRRMGGVENMQLDALIGIDVFDDLRPHIAPGRQRPGEAVLDHPLRERLALHAGFVVHSQRGGDAGAMCFAGGRHDAVHQRQGKSGVGAQPASQLWQGARRESFDSGGQARTIVLQIVAGNDRHRPGAVSAPFLQPQRQPADGGSWALRRGQIGDDVGMGEIEFALGIQAIAFLRKRQRHGMRGGRSQRHLQCRRIARREQRLFQHAHDAIAGGLVQSLDGIKTILRRQRIGHIGPLQRGADDDPIATGFQDRIFREHRLVGAMESADAQMDNAGLQCGAVKLRPAHGGGQARQRRLVQARHNR